MSDTTRRGFVKSSAATAAGMTMIGTIVAEQAETADAATSPNPDGAVVAYLRDAGSGEVSVLVGQREITVHDRQLAARIARAAR